jgi:magnesium chelatase family protein
VADVRQVQLADASGTVTYPAWFQLVLAAQPCPCVHPTEDQPCICTQQDRRRYLSRMAELWQRTDIRLRLGVTDPHDTTAGESSATVAERVARARELAADRWAALGYRVNADVPSSVLRDGVCRLPARVINPLLRLLRLGVICGDGHDRVLRLAWSISDLHDRDRPHLDDVDAAVELYIEQQP